MKTKDKLQPDQTKMQDELAPRLRFPEFQDAGEWERKYLEDFATIVRGGSPRPIDEYITNDTNGLNWLKIGDIGKESKFITTTQEKVISAALTKTRVVNSGDLILSNSMSFGRPYILKIKTCIHDGWIAVSKIDNGIDRYYLYYLMMIPASQVYFSNNAAGSGVQNLNADIIKLLPVLYPSLPEQQRIADCLSSLDERITTEAQKLDLLKAHKKGLAQKLFPAEGQTLPRPRFPEFRDDRPWSFQSLGKLAKYSTRKNAGGDITRVLTNSAEFGVIDQRDFFDKDIANQGNLEGYYIVEEGDYVYNPRISTVAPVGPVSKNKIGLGVMSPLYTVFRFNNQQDDFYAHYFKSTHWHHYMRQASSTGARHDRMSITNNDFMGMPLPVSTPEEQQKIADCLSSLDDLITAQARKVELLKTHKKGLMQQLFPALDEVRG